MEVDPVHVEPLDLLEVGDLCLCGDDALELGVPGLDLVLHLLGLGGDEAELGDVAGGVAGGVVVAELG